MWVTINSTQRYISESQNAYIASTGVDRTYVLALLGLGNESGYEAELILNGVNHPLNDKVKHKFSRTDNVHFNIIKLESVPEKFPEQEFLESLNRDYDQDTYTNMNALEKALIRKAYYFGKSRL